MNKEIDRKRVACLYRVSTKKQTDGDEIPMQTKECHEFIKKHPGWVIEKEYAEKGVSGYKVSAIKRDVLQDAILDAQKGIYDILLVFKSERLSRIANETNPNIEAFCKFGVEVWSVCEGDLTIRSLDDSLMSFVRGFSNESESVKTSKFVDAKHRQMVAEGLSRGGGLPFGYEYFKNGRFGGRDKNKRKELYDVRINEEEAEIVRLIFDLYNNHGFGGVRIAKDLDKRGILTREGKSWLGQNIVRLLKNPIYAGFYAYGKTSKKKDARSYRQDRENWILSHQLPNLQIIDDDLWARTVELMFEKSAMVRSNSNPFPRKGNLLFTGLARCGHCGHMLRLIVLKKRWPRKDGSFGEQKVSKYRCYHKASGGRCDGQTEYGKKKIEGAVMSEVYRYLDSLGRFDLSDDYYSQKNEKLKELAKQVDIIKKRLADAVKEIEVLESEIVRSLLGNSNFSSEQLSKALNSKEIEILDLKATLLEVEGKIEVQKSQAEDLDKVRILSQSFRNAFDDMSIDEKKMILKEIIGSIFIWHDRIEINMKINISSLSEVFLDEKKKYKPNRVIEGSISTQLSDKK